MEQNQKKQRIVGLLTFFISGICAISAGIVVSILQEKYGFAYSMTGTLLSLMSMLWDILPCVYQEKWQY